MRVALVFAPVFMAWGREIVRALNAKGVEVAGICMTQAVYDELAADKSLSFARLDNIDALERQWLAASYDPAALLLHEQSWGAALVKRLVIADRQAGGGYVTGGPLPASAFRRAFAQREESLQSFCTGLLDYLTDLFENWKPDTVMSYVVAGALPLGVAEGAHKYGARFYNFVHSRVGSRVILDSSPLGLFDPVRATFEKLKKTPALVDAHRDEAKSWLAAYRESLDKMPEYEQRNRARLSEGRKLPVIAKSFATEVAKAILYPFLRGQRPFRGEAGWQKVWRSLAWPLGALWYIGRDRLYTPVSGIKAAPYIYYALHVEPEASTMVVSPYHTNQLAVIEALAKALPVSWRLVVKEHPSMLGKRPFGFYNKIRNMPGVCLAAPYENSLQLVRGSAVTATITGTVAWEAVLLGRPALVVGNSPFLMLGEGIAHCADLSALDTAIDEAAHMKPVAEEKLTDFVATIFKEAIDFPLGLLWDNPDQTHLDANRHITERVVATLCGEG